MRWLEQKIPLAVRWVAQHSVHPTLRQAQGPLVGVGAFSSSLRGLKLVPAKWRHLVSPGCRLA
jgi:hypothetical protein